jgi:protein TorT
VNYGLVEEAERLGLRVRLFEAGGYGNLEDQILQAERCLEDDVDGFIVSAVDFEGLTLTLEKIHGAGKPIVDLINGASFAEFSARAAVDYYDLAHIIGRHIVDKHADDDRDIGVIWFPGPKLAGWASRADSGFNDALAGTRVIIKQTGYGDTGKRTQGRLVEEAMTAVGSVDYIVGTTVTAEAAVDIVRKKRLQGETSVLSYYFGPGVNVGLRRGTIEAAISEQQAILGRIALDQLARILEGEEYHRHVGTRPLLLDRDMLSNFDSSTSLAPRGFTTRFNVN